MQIKNLLNNLQYERNIKMDQNKKFKLTIIGEYSPYLMKNG